MSKNKTVEPKMKSICVFFLLIICGFTSTNILTRYGFHRRSFLKKHVRFNHGIDITEAPYIAAVVHSDFSHPRNRYMTASIITKRFLISAPRHPITMDLQNYIVYVGQNNLQELDRRNSYEVEDIIFNIPYESYDQKYNDIIMIMVSEDIKFNIYQRPITLLTQYHYDKALVYNHSSWFKIVGYGGHTDSYNRFSGMGVLQSKNLTIEHPPDLSNINFVVKNTGPYTCEGDVGTPLIFANRLAGVFARDTDSTDNGEFTGIISQYEWIVNVVGEDELKRIEEDERKSIGLLHHIHN